jgi:hypothetical protein
VLLKEAARLLTIAELEKQTLNSKLTEVTIAYGQEIATLKDQVG